MPQFDDLVAGVYRDLADESEAVFSRLQVEDFIRGGIADLNRVAPTDTIDDIDFVLDPDTGAIMAYEYATVIELPYRVETIRLSDGWGEVIPEIDSGQAQSTGFHFRQSPDGGIIAFPKWWLAQMDAAVWGIRLYGYAARPLPYTVDGEPSPQVSLSQNDEYSVRAYAKSAGFDLLAHDRSLFGQWQGQSNNTDVSPTQMLQMAAGAKQEWDRHRGLIRVVRRYW